MDTSPTAKAEITLPLMIVHLFVLCALVFAKPLYDIMADHPEYFIVHRISNLEIYLFIIVLAAAIPLCFSVPLLLARMWSKGFRLFLQTCFVFMLTGVFVLQLTNRIAFLSAPVCVSVSLLVAGIVGFQYPRNRQFSICLLFLTPIIFVFPLLFLFDSDMQRVLYPNAKLGQGDIDSGAVWVNNKPPIVMIVFDEFPLVDLLDFEGNIDAKRFPNFAEFASESTWYANATTVWQSTLGAVPAILTGKYHVPGLLARHHDHPANLFSLLRGHYDFHVVEPVTQLNLKSKTETDDNERETIRSWASRMQTFVEDLGVLYLHDSLPEAYRKVLPDIDNQWGGFLTERTVIGELTFSPEELSQIRLHMIQGAELKQRRRAALTNSDRKRTFEEFVSRIQDAPASTLHFIHISLPHTPIRYLPSGRRYTDGKVAGISVSAVNGRYVYTGGEFPLIRDHQNHLLQVGFTDTLLGTLIRELKTIGIYDDALIVICADHGKSFQLGVPSRSVAPENMGDIAFIPLFFKYPNQEFGVRDDSNVETIDILPTIRDVVGAKVLWEFDGRSLLDTVAQPREMKLIGNREGQIFEYNRQEYLAARDDALGRKVKTFSLDDPRSDLFHFGVALDLIGKPKSLLEPKAVRASISCPGIEELQEVDLNLDYLPTHLKGTVKASERNPVDLHLVFSVNGMIQAVTRPYEINGRFFFDVVLSDSVFKQGKNDVKVLLVDLDETSHDASTNPDLASITIDTAAAVDILILGAATRSIGTSEFATDAKAFEGADTSRFGDA